MTHYAFGAYGTNNVGDEAIFWGLYAERHDAVQIYINKSNLESSVWYADFLNGRKNFAKGDHLTIGGGGLLYNRAAVETMLTLARMAAAVGCSVSVEGIGCEALEDDYVGVVRSLLSRAGLISVRSSISAEILKSRVGVDAKVVPDFAFNLSDLFKPADQPRDTVTIGLVLAGNAFRGDYTNLRRIIMNWTDNHMVKFVHIPHSKSYVDINNNDLMVGQRIWSSIEIYHKQRESLFEALDFTVDVGAVAAHYGELDAVISERYHGMVFGTMCDIPVIAASGNLKNRSFIEDRPDARILAYKGDQELEDAVAEVIETASR